EAHHRRGLPDHTPPSIPAPPRGCALRWCDVGLLSLACCLGLHLTRPFLPLNTDSRVKQTVEYVGDQVGDDQDHRNNQDGHLEHGYVLAERCLQQELSEPRVVEYVFYYHQTADQPGNLVGDDGNSRQQRI